MRQAGTPAPRRVVIDADGASADLACVDRLARLQLAARRRGEHVVLANASPALARLLALTGLADVVPLVPGLGLEALGQTEVGEQVRADERRDAEDPPL